VREANSRLEQTEQQLSGEAFQVEKATVSDQMRIDQDDVPEPKPQKRSANAAERTRQTVRQRQLHGLGGWDLVEEG